MRAGESIWASTTFEIARENLNVGLTIANGIDVPGRFIAAEGAKLPRPKSVRICLLADGGAEAPPEISDQGEFVMRSLPWQRYRVGVVNLPTHYVKKMRYNGAPITDGIIPAATHHREIRGGTVVAENTFTCSDFKRFGASADIRFEVEQ